MTPNQHGTWAVREDRADKKGPPYPPFPLCSYCGSMTPDDFLDQIRKGAKVGGSDWKYGYPHKFYVDIPNPNPDEKRIVGWGPGEDDVTWSTYPTLHLKFYTEHLEGWEPLKDEKVQDEIYRATGISFKFGDDGRVVYSAPCFGYQR